MKYEIIAPKWNPNLFRYESNVILIFTGEIIAIGCGEGVFEAEDRAEMIVAGLKLYDAMSENNTPVTSIGIPPVG